MCRWSVDRQKAGYAARAVQHLSLGGRESVLHRQLAPFLTSKILQWEWQFLLCIWSRIGANAESICGTHSIFLPPERKHLPALCFSVYGSTPSFTEWRRRLLTEGRGLCDSKVKKTASNFFCHHSFKMSLYWKTQLLSSTRIYVDFARQHGPTATWKWFICGIHELWLSHYFILVQTFDDTNRKKKTIKWWILLWWPERAGGDWIEV